MLGLQAIPAPLHRATVARIAEAAAGAGWGTRTSKRQGLIVGKRCGTTQNIGPAARERWQNGLHQVKQAAVQT
jgi:hypothetical protein